MDLRLNEFRPWRSLIRPDCHPPLRTNGQKKQEASLNSLQFVASLSGLLETLLVDHEVNLTVENMKQCHKLIYGFLVICLIKQAIELSG